VYHFGPVSSAAPRRRRFAGRKFSLGSDLTTCAKEDRGTKTIKKPYARSTETLNGDLFKKYYAACQAVALGDRPAAEALMKRPADLTHFAQKRWCFPELKVMDYIEGRMCGGPPQPGYAHLRYPFSQMSSNPDLIHVRTFGLFKQVEQLLAPSESHTPHMRRALAEPGT
jgi:hypothetical protein